MMGRYAVIRMAFVRLPDGRYEGPELLKGAAEIWPETHEGLSDMLKVVMPHFKEPPRSPGIWIQRYKIKLDGEKIAVLWARWKEATIEEARELQRVMESER